MGPNDENDIVQKIKAYLSWLNDQLNRAKKDAQEDGYLSSIGSNGRVSGYETALSNFRDLVVSVIPGDLEKALGEFSNFLKSETQKWRQISKDDGWHGSISSGATATALSESKYKLSNYFPQLARDNVR